MTTWWPFITRSPETRPTSGSPPPPPPRPAPGCPRPPGDGVAPAAPRPARGAARPARGPPQPGPAQRRPQAPRQLERLDPRHPLLARAVDDAIVGAALAPERHRVPAALELATRARRPVGVRRPAPARHQVQDPHRRALTGPAGRRASRGTHARRSRRRAPG